MRHLKSFNQYTINESTEGLGDVLKLINNIDLLKKIFEFANEADIDKLIQKFGTMEEMIQVFKDANESVASMKPVISALFAKNPKPIYKAKLDIMCNYLKTKYKATEDNIKFLKQAIFDFAKNFNVPVK